MKNKQQPINLKKAALVSALLLELAGTASAATINVDGATCTLADAITAANTDAIAGGCTAGMGADEIELDISGSPFNLTEALPNIISVITINGNDSTVERDAASLTKFKIFQVNDGAGATGGDLQLNDITVTGGSSPDDPTSGNLANFSGGARAYAGGILNISNATFTGNTGGAVIFSPGTSGSIVDTVIDNNQGNTGAGYYGGGVSIVAATVTVSNSTISNNTTDSTIGSGAVYISNYGGDADVTVTNTTISGNSSTLRGGGISHLAYGNSSTIALTNVTVVSNTSAANGGGISNDSADMTFSQSLISGNTAVAGAEMESTGGTVTVDDFNLFGLLGVSNVVGVTVGASDIVPMETLTDIIDTTLGDNGGATPTHALPMGSPAIDAVPAASCASATDQTGKARPIDGDGDMTADCDIGAFENEAIVDLIFEDGFESP